jgi:hypothetical protein
MGDRAPSFERKRKAEHDDRSGKASEYQTCILHVICMHQCDEILVVVFVLAVKGQFGERKTKEFKPRAFDGKPKTGKSFGGKPGGSKFGGRPEGGKFGGKPVGKFGGKPEGGKFGGKPGGKFGGKPFDKKPFGGKGGKPFKKSSEGGFGAKHFDKSANKGKPTADSAEDDAQKLDVREHLSLLLKFGANWRASAFRYQTTPVSVLFFLILIFHPPRLPASLQIAHDHKEQKQLRMQRKGANPTFGLVTELKEIWEKARVKEMKKEERKPLVDELMSRIEGHIKQVCFCLSVIVLLLLLLLCCCSCRGCCCCSDV